MSTLSFRRYARVVLRTESQKISPRRHGDTEKSQKTKNEKRKTKKIYFVLIGKWIQFRTATGYLYFIFLNYCFIFDFLSFPPCLRVSVVKSFDLAFDLKFDRKSAKKSQGITTLTSHFQKAPIEVHPDKKLQDICRVLCHFNTLVIRLIDSWQYPNRRFQTIVGL